MEQREDGHIMTTQTHTSIEKEGTDTKEDKNEDSPKENDASNLHLPGSDSTNMRRVEKIKQDADAHDDCDIEGLKRVDMTGKEQSEKDGNATQKGDHLDIVLNTEQHTDETKGVPPKASNKMEEVSSAIGGEEEYDAQELELQQTDELEEGEVSKEESKSEVNPDKISYSIPATKAKLSKASLRKASWTDRYLSQHWGPKPLIPKSTQKETESAQEIGPEALVHDDGAEEISKKRNRSPAKKSAKESPPPKKRRIDEEKQHESKQKEEVSQGNGKTDRYRSKRGKEALVRRKSNRRR